MGRGQRRCELSAVFERFVPLCPCLALASLSLSLLELDLLTRHIPHAQCGRKRPDIAQTSRALRSCTRSAHTTAAPDGFPASLPPQFRINGRILTASEITAEVSKAVSEAERAAEAAVAAAREYDEAEAAAAELERAAGMHAMHPGQPQWTRAGGKPLRAAS